jgi:hypothetical protein
MCLLRISFVYLFTRGKHDRWNLFSSNDMNAIIWLTNQRIWEAFMLVTNEILRKMTDIELISRDFIFRCKCRERNEKLLVFNQCCFCFIRKNRHLIFWGEYLNKIELYFDIYYFIPYLLLGKSSRQVYYIELLKRTEVSW